MSALIQGERHLGHWHTLLRGKEERREGRRGEGEEGEKKREEEVGFGNEFLSVYETECTTSSQ